MLTKIDTEIIHFNPRLIDISILAVTQSCIAKLIVSGIALNTASHENVMERATYTSYKT